MIINKPQLLLFGSEYFVLFFISTDKRFELYSLCLVFLWIKCIFIRLQFYKILGYAISVLRVFIKFDISKVKSTIYNAFFKSSYF